MLSFWQAKMSKSFSSPYTSSALMCFMAGVQCFVIAAGVERSFSAWALGWDIRLAASLYTVTHVHEEQICSRYHILVC